MCEITYLHSASSLDSEPIPNHPLSFHGHVTFSHGYLVGPALFYSGNDSILAFEEFEKDEDGEETSVIKPGSWVKRYTQKKTIRMHDYYEQSNDEH